MRAVRSLIRMFRRGLRSGVAILLIFTAAFNVPAIALPLGMTGQGSDATMGSKAHCHETGHASRHDSRTHACCTDGECVCALGAACIVSCTVRVAAASTQALLIPFASSAEIPLGLRSPLFRPPIA